MRTINISEFESDFVIHFGGEPKRINAYTLASTLVSIADAVKTANSIINPGCEVEVVVEAFGSGSFKAKIRAIYNQAVSNLFSSEHVKTIVFSVIAAFIYDHTLSGKPNVDITVNTDEVIINDGETKIIVPREVHDNVKKVEKSDKFTQSINRTFETVAKDKDVASLGFTSKMDDELPIVSVPREKFSLLAAPISIDENQRTIIENADLHILRAILDRGNRKWEFVWRGIKISAPVLDNQFYDRFFAHEIMIAPGDSIEVQLKIYQTRDKDVGIFTNNRYEVIQVIRHIPRFKQQTF